MMADCDNIEFIEIKKEEAFKLIPDAQDKINWTRYQIGYFNDEPIVVIFWEDNEPHVEYLTVNPKIVLKGTIAFVNQHDCVIHSLKHTKNLFDRVCKKTKLKFVGQRFDIYGRGVDYIYEVKNAT